MSIRIVSAIIVLLFFSMTHWSVYVKGKKAVQAEWNVAVLQAKEAANEIERTNRISKEKALEDRTKQLVQNNIASDRARIASERMRDTSEQSLAQARASHDAAIISATTHKELLDSCRNEYRDMGQKAQGHATDIKTLIDAWPK